MKPKRTLDFTKGSILKKLVVFTIPIILSNLLQHFYTMTDRIVVGRFAENGEIALAAVGSTGQATALILNLFVGVAIGANVVCSNLRGARKGKELREAMHSSLILAGIFGVFLMILGVCIAKPVLRMMNTPESVLQASALYMRIYFLGVPASLLYNFSSAILRAHGDTRRPMYILATSGLVNVCLNLVLVIVFHLDVAGVAIATITAQYISATTALIILFRKNDEYKLTFKELKLHKAQVKKMVSIGVPCGINGIVFNISNVTVQSAVNSFNDPIIMSGSTVAADLTTLVYQVLVAFYTACISFTGQCYGARLYKRIDKLVVRAILLSVGLVSTMATLVTVFHRPVMALYTDNPAVIDAGQVKMIMIAWGYILYGASEIFLGCLRGMGRSSLPTLFNLLSICVPRLLWVAFIFPLHRTFNFLFICYPISWVVSLTVQAWYFFHCRRKDNRKLRQTEEAALLKEAKAAQA